VQEAIRSYLLDWDRLDRRGDKRVEEACVSWSKLVGCLPEEACFQPNTSAGLSIVAGALRLRRGDNVIVNDLENPANQIPWLGLRRSGVEVRVVKGRGGRLHAEDIEKAADDSTKVVALSHVEWMTGARHDLKEFADVAHDRGGYLVVDGIQAAGAVRVDVKRDAVDFYACGAYKWLLGCSGAGFLYVSREHVSAMDPPTWGYRAVEENSLGEPRFKADAKKFEQGEPSYLSTVGTKAGIDLILSIGASAVEARVLKLSALLQEGLRHIGAQAASPEEKESRSGITSFTTRNTEASYKALRDAGFYLSLRPAGIRVASDFYNTEEEVSGLLDTVQRSTV
jgi:selenocysteine lyase/cysteine desulfurase